MVMACAGSPDSLWCEYTRAFARRMRARLGDAGSLLRDGARLSGAQGVEKEAALLQTLEGSLSMLLLPPPSCMNSEDGSAAAGLRVEGASRPASAMLADWRRACTSAGSVQVTYSHARLHEGGHGGPRGVAGYADAGVGGLHSCEPTPEGIAAEALRLPQPQREASQRCSQAGGQATCMPPAGLRLSLRLLRRAAWDTAGYAMPSPKQLAMPHERELKLDQDGLASLQGLQALGAAAALQSGGPVRHPPPYYYTILK